MDIFYPFIHEPEVKETFEPLPLYAEIILPLITEDEEKKESKVIIIDLF